MKNEKPLNRLNRGFWLLKPNQTIETVKLQFHGLVQSKLLSIATLLIEQRAIVVFVVSLGHIFPWLAWDDYMLPYCHFCIVGHIFPWLPLLGFDLLPLSLQVVNSYHLIYAFL